MQHLMVEDVLNKPLRYFRRIESLADRDAVVNVVMMTQNASRPSLRPCDIGLAQLPIKVAFIQLGEHAVEIINLAMS